VKDIPSVQEVASKRSFKSIDVLMMTKLGLKLKGLII